ncbi:MAG: PEP-CTERM sorting domain-containing protein [Pirellulales bacterium]
MLKKIASFTAIVFVFGLMTTTSYGQLDGLYEFDGGGDGTSWDDASNWEQVLDPFGAPISGDPATPPNAITSVEIPMLGVVLIDNTQPGQTARNVKIGTSGGTGSLTISGGDLTGRDINVGGDNVGFNLGLLTLTNGNLVAGDDITVGAGSVGVMVMSGGTADVNDDFFVNANSSFTMAGGSLTIGDRLVTLDNAGLVVNGGDIVADDDFFFFGTSQITVNSGSMIVKDKLRFDDVLTAGKLTINSGLVRSQEFGFFDGTNYVMNGTLEINDGGVYQSQQPTSPTSPVSQLTEAAAWALIADGTIITSEVAPLHLGVSTVIVPDFFGGTNLQFTQISIVPEPTSMLLLSLGSLGLLLRKKRSC